MSDVRELARECYDLSRAKCIGDPWVHDALHDASDGVSGHGHIVGALRMFVEVECERRGWCVSWRQYPNAWAWSVRDWAATAGMLSDHTVGGVPVIEVATALKCALLALKWLLENPQEEA